MHDKTKPSSMGGGEGYKDCKENKTVNNATNLFRKYIHDIRNMKNLSKEMIDNICNMSNEEKIDIIIAFNDIVEIIHILLEE
jgi:hypothetical protein